MYNTDVVFSNILQTSSGLSDTIYHVVFFNLLAHVGVLGDVRIHCNETCCNKVAVFICTLLTVYCHDLVFSTIIFYLFFGNVQH